MLMLGYSIPEQNSVSRAQLVSLENRLTASSIDVFSLKHLVDNLYKLNRSVEEKLITLHRLTEIYNFNFIYQSNKIRELEKENRKLKGLLASVTKATHRGFERINNSGKVEDREIEQLQKAFGNLRIK